MLPPLAEVLVVLHQQGGGLVPGRFGHAVNEPVQAELANRVAKPDAVKKLFDVLPLNPMLGAGMLTVKQVAERLGVSSSQVYALCSSGKLAHYRFGVGKGALRISEEQLAAFLAATTFKPPAAELPELRHIRLHDGRRPGDASAFR